MEGTKFREVLHLMQENLECAICLELLKNPLSTKCDHQFCSFCIVKFVGNQRYVPCPLCKKPISKRSLQERPELGNVVNKVQDLIDAFKKDACKDDEESTNDKRPVPDAQSFVAEMQNIAPSISKKSKLIGSSDPGPTKKPLDYTENCSELDLAAEGDLQKYLSNSLAETESASKRSRGRQRKTNNTTGTDSKVSNGNNITSLAQDEEGFASNGQSKRGKDEKDLLRYLEEGSCGAVYDDDTRPSESSVSGVSQTDEGFNTFSIMDKENQLKTDICNEKPRESSGHMTPVMAKKRGGIRPPMSPSKSNSNTRPAPKDVDSNFSPDNRDSTEDQHGEVCATPITPLLRESPQLTAGNKKLMTPDSDSASISSTQQLMKEKPVVSRTYSKVMKATFMSDGGAKNWRETLPSPHTNSASYPGNPILKGLTTKEKIALKKKQNAPVSNDSIAESLMPEQKDSNSTKPDAIPSVPSVLDAPHQMRRRSIFKSHREKSEQKLQQGLETGLKGTDTSGPAKGKIEEDPYEFHGSQTPKKKSKEISIRGGLSGRGTKKGSKQLISRVTPQSQKAGQIEIISSKSSASRGKECGESSKNKHSENDTKPKDDETDSKREEKAAGSNNKERKLGLNSNKNVDGSKDQAACSNDNDREAVLKHRDTKCVSISASTKCKEDQFTEVSLVKSKKVYFADEWCENRKDHDNVPQIGQQLKSCLQKTSKPRLDTEMRDVKKFSPGEKINNKDVLNLAGRPCQGRRTRSSSDILPDNTQMIESNVVETKESKHAQSENNDKSAEVGKDRREKHCGNEDPSKGVEVRSKISEQNIVTLEQEHLENIYEDAQNIIKAPKQKRGTKRKQACENGGTSSSVGKRTLSRRLKNAASSEDTEMLKRQSEAEIAKMTVKINEAEDHEFAFCTQEAHMKMQEGQEKEDQFKEAFGFDTLLQEQVESVLKQNVVKETAEKQTLNEIGCDQTIPLCQKRDDMKASYPTTLLGEGESKKSACQKKESSKSGQKNAKKETSSTSSATGDGESNDKGKTTKETSSWDSANGKCQGYATKTVGSCHNVAVTSASRRNTSKLVSSQSGLPSHAPTFTSNVTSIEKHIPRFSKPNVSLMVQIFPSPSEVGSTPQSTANVVEGTPCVAGSVLKHLQSKAKVMHHVESSASKRPSAVCEDNERIPQTPFTPEAEQDVTLSQEGLSYNFEDPAKSHLGSVGTTGTESMHQAVPGALPISADSNYDKGRDTNIVGEHTCQKDTDHQEKISDKFCNKAALCKSRQVSDHSLTVGHNQASDADSADVNREGVLAQDSMCLDCDLKDQDGENDSHATIPDSELPSTKDVEVRMDQPYKRAEVEVVEETQGNETCIPASTDDEFATRKYMSRVCSNLSNCEPNSLDAHSQGNVNTDKGEVTRVNFAPSQPVTILTKSERKEKPEEASSSSLCLLSQSILQTSKNQKEASSSDNTSNVSSCFSGTILPSAQEVLPVAQSLVLAKENQKSNCIPHNNDNKNLRQEGRPSKRQKIDSAVDIHAHSSDENDIEDSEDNDEDEVLMRRRPEGQSLSTQIETIQPIVYETPNMESHLDKHAVDFEMIGETQALDVLETESQDMENCTFQETPFDKNHGEDIATSREQVETIKETECDSGENVTEVDKEQIDAPVDEIRCSEGIRKYGEELKTLISQHDCLEQSSLICQNKSRQSLISTSIEHVTGEGARLRQNSERQCAEEVKFAKMICDLKDPKGIRSDKVENSYRGESTNGLSPSAHGPSPNSTLQTPEHMKPISSVNEGSRTPSTGSERTRRTRRGLAAKLATSGDGQTLSAGAQEAIRISVQETKSRLETVSSDGKKTVSDSIPEVIDLEKEVEEKKYENMNIHAYSRDNKSKPSHKMNKNLGRKSKTADIILSDEEKVPTQVRMSDGKNSNKSSNINTSVFNAKDHTGPGQENRTTDQVMSNLKACFVSSSEDSSDEEELKSNKFKSCDGPTLNQSPVTERVLIADQPHPNSSMKSCPSALADPPVEDAQDNSQPESLDKSIITGVEESSVNSDNDIDGEADEEEISANIRGRKRLRQQITSDSDEPDEEEQSQSKSSVSSVVSSQAEILSTQQAEALEGDVDKLRKEIALYEARLGARPYLDSDDAENEEDAETDDEDDMDEEDETTKQADSASLCKRLPDVFEVDESPLTATDTAAATAAEDKSEDDLFVSPLSPSPPSKKSKMKIPPSKCPRLSEPATQPSENFLKQFQSPGGTVRKKKQLDFVQSSLNSFIKTTHSGNSLEPRPERKEGSDELHQRPTSPVLSSQRSRLPQGKEAKDVGPGNVDTPSRRICFVTSGLTREDNAYALALAKKMNMEFSTKFIKDVTHVIMKTESDQSHVCDRTLKFFQGVAHKCWVVGFSWVKKSLSMNRLLPEDGFEVTGDTSAGKFAGGARRARESDQSLFADFCFACVGTSQEMPKESLFELLAVCGAKCVEDPVALMSQSVKHKIIVRCSDSDAEPSAVEIDMFNGLYKHMGLVTVMREWILDSLGSYTVQPMAGYVLNTVDSVQLPF